MSYTKIEDLSIPSNITLIEVIKPNELENVYRNTDNDNLNNLLLEKIRNKICNKCNNKGYVNDDIEIISRSIGKINAAHFTGDIHYNVKLRINICIPLIGTKIKTKVIGKNEAGVLCAVEPFKIMISPLNEETNDLNNEDEVIIEVIQYKVDINEKYIKILGKFIEKL